ncbi:MAG: hypothetical protein ACI8XG_001886 [Congregibacter sp.]|jgi:hypothetical protein
MAATHYESSTSVCLKLKSVTVQVLNTLLEGTLKKVIKLHT